MGWQTFLITTDTHGELIDKDYERRILGWIKDHKPKRIFHLGDVFDMSSIRRGASSEERSHSLSEDIHKGLAYLRKLQEASPASNLEAITWGNHDYRLFNMAESTREGLEFDYARMLRKEIEKNVAVIGCATRDYDVERGWYEIAPRGSRSGPKLIGHGYAATISPARTACQHWGSTITGHVHRFDTHQNDDLGRNESYVIACGCQIAQDYNRTHRRRLSHSVGFGWGVTNDRTGDWIVWFIKRNKEGTWLDPKKHQMK